MKANQAYAPDSRTLNPPLPVKVQERPPVHDALARMGEVLSDLDSALGALAARLDPVLSPASPTTADTAERPSPGSAPVTVDINDYANRVVRFAAAVREISNRLEI